MSARDAIVVGGGLVGAAIAYGLARLGLKPVVFDEGDLAFRAARGNFGLVTVQSKGAENFAYHRWTRRSADRWATLAAELLDTTGVDVGHVRKGAITPLLDAGERRDVERQLEALRAAAGDLGFEYRMLARDQVAELVPDIGQAVIGGAFTAYDGQCAPLALLRALHVGLIRAGGRYVPNARVERIAAKPRQFTVSAGGEKATAPRIVLAAGLGTGALAGRLGLVAPVRPDRGQILVTERMRALLPMPLRPLIRQTPEGAVMLGISSEDAGYDDRTRTPTLRAIAERAVRILPCLRTARVVRAWSALRVMTPDEYPVYDQSGRLPGAFVACCHSGVTLAAAHVFELARHIAEGAIPDELACFSARRFVASGAARNLETA